MKNKKEKFFILIVLVLVLINFQGCSFLSSSPKPSEKEIKKFSKVSYKNETKYKFIEFNSTLPQIPSELLEPVFLVPSYETARVPILQRKVTIKVSKIPLKELVKLISETTDVNIILFPDTMSKNSLISLDVKNKSLKEVLDIICEYLNIYYEVQDNAIFLKKYKTKYYDVGIPGIQVNPSPQGIGSVGGKGGSSGIAKVSYSFKGLENMDPYKKLESMLAIFRSNGGLKNYKIDRDTGLLIVTATPETLKKIDKLIEKFKQFYSKQVKVEMTIIEVTYNKGSERSINWDLLIPKFLEKFSFSFSSSEGGQLLVGTSKYSSLPSGAVKFGNTLSIQNMVLNFLKQYGTTEIVATPTLRLTNGYSAMVVVGEEIPLVKKVKSVTGNTTEYSYDINDICFDGLLLNVKVRINELNEIYLQIIPVINTCLKYILTSGDIYTEYARNIQRQTATVLKLSDGGIAIIAGLRQREFSRNLEGIPGLMDTKILGLLGSKKSSQIKEKEIIMIIRAKLVY